MLYANRTGIPWRYLPHDYPHWNARWQEEGVFDQLNTPLRRQVLRHEGREEEPTACVSDMLSHPAPSDTGEGVAGVDRRSQGDPLLLGGVAVDRQDTGIAAGVADLGDVLALADDARASAGTDGADPSGEVAAPSAEIPA